MVPLVTVPLVPLVPPVPLVPLVPLVPVPLPPLVPVAPRLPAHLGLKMDAIQVQKWSKMKMFKIDPEPFRVLKNAFWARLGPGSARFEAPFGRKAGAGGSKWVPYGSKNGPK